MTDDRVSVVGSPVSMSCGNVTEEVRSSRCIQLRLDLCYREARRDAGRNVPLLAGTLKMYAPCHVPYHLTNRQL